ncbi:hypothetical protein Moror_9392 [Moniliophthora roreri MCA 2997]|uniref:Uncharacterized protein n=1 Tax=Moniliophthora roreri (strain MCA 2997) TaxID=1381753 RepID=V2WZU6_MONRO|nr:hypothetical protein Moror_9392 [Moniliophthora roreri MCA 2997]
MIARRSLKKSVSATFGLIGYDIGIGPSYQYYADIEEYWLRENRDRQALGRISYRLQNLRRTIERGSTKLMDLVNSANGNTNTTKLHFPSCSLSKPKKLRFGGETPTARLMKNTKLRVVTGDGVGQAKTKLLRLSLVRYASARKTHIRLRE